MGFGHRVYKNYDPRATVIRGICAGTRRISVDNDPLFKIARKLEKLALEDDYFIERKLFPNVDFYSGIILKQLVFQQVYLLLSCYGSNAGWIAHWHEMLSIPIRSVDQDNYIKGPLYATTQIRISN